MARQTTTPPLIFDLLAAEPFSMMRVLGPLLWLYDRVDTGLAETPAFRDIDGDCVIPGNLRLLAALAATCVGRKCRACTSRVCAAHASFSDVTLRTSLALGSGPMQRGSPERARAPSGRPS